MVLGCMLFENVHFYHHNHQMLAWFHYIVSSSDGGAFTDKCGVRGPSERLFPDCCFRKALDQIRE